MEIEIKAPSLNFEDHLHLQGNSRIIFSGIYGIGKTTFLKKYFSEDRQLGAYGGKVKYNTFHLFPVNYSVASNEDIFKLIKYDIVYELIKKGSPFEKEDFSYLETIKPFLCGNIHNVLAPFFLTLGPTGRNMFDFFKEQRENIAKFFKYHDGLQIDDEKTLAGYLSKTQGTEGSIYELDLYSKLIKITLERFREINKESQNVLILDDLDRIDPHHIFRLFNVFGAHFDLTRNGNENKFGFDKVIFVCDIENIANIFRNRYGENVDFAGYIDKFYSYQIHKYTNRDAVYSWLKEGLELEAYNRELSAYSLQDLCFICDILVNMMDMHEINLRNLKKVEWKKFQFKLSNRKFERAWFPKIGVFLSFIVGDSEVLLKKIENCQRKYISSNRTQFGEEADSSKGYLFWYLLPISEFLTHNLKIGIGYSAKIKEYANVSIPYNLQHEGHSIIGVENGNRTIDSDQYLWSKLFDAVSVLKANRII